MKIVIRLIILSLFAILIIFSINKSNRANDLLLLVNKNNPIKKDYNPNLSSYDGKYFAKELIIAFKEMENSLKKENISFKVGDGYISIRSQERLFESKARQYIKKGLTDEEAKLKTAETILLPRYSEHHTGLAIDLKGDNSLYNWLLNNSYKFGFILRYPEDKEKITKYNYDKEHYRYVGKETAKKMFEKNLCLEEYLEIYKEEEHGNIKS